MSVKTVLLVDDSKASRMIVGKSVKKLGHQILGEACDGHQGFEMYCKLKPDVVLSDIEMPNMNGYDMLKKIIEFDRGANVVMITSVVNAQYIKKIMALGALDSIKKPINEEKMKKIFDLIG